MGDIIETKYRRDNCWRNDTRLFPRARGNKLPRERTYQEPGTVTQTHSQVNGHRPCEQPRDHTCRWRCTWPAAAVKHPTPEVLLKQILTDPLGLGQGVRGLVWRAPKWWCLCCWLQDHTWSGTGLGKWLSPLAAHWNHRGSYTSTPAGLTPRSSGLINLGHSLDIRIF